MIDVDKLVAGPELDALVAEKVMGCKAVRHVNDAPGGDRNDRSEDYWTCECDENRPHGQLEESGHYRLSFLSEFSTDIAAAWEVVEKFCKFRVDNHGHYEDMKLRYMCEVYDENRDLHSGKVFGETAPLAICRAVLKAVGA